MHAITNDVIRQVYYPKSKCGRPSHRRANGGECVRRRRRSLAESSRQPDAQRHLRPVTEPLVNCAPLPLEPAGMILQRVACLAACVLLLAGCAATGRASRPAGSRSRTGPRPRRHPRRDGLDADRGRVRRAEPDGVRRRPRRARCRAGRSRARRAAGGRARAQRQGPAHAAAGDHPRHRRDGAGEHALQRRPHASPDRSRPAGRGLPPRLRSSAGSPGCGAPRRRAWAAPRPSSTMPRRAGSRSATSPTAPARRATRRCARRNRPVATWSSKDCRWPTARAT